MATDAQRTAAWLDTLDVPQHDLALRVLDMPGGNMANAYVAVMVHQLERRYDLLPVAVSAEVAKMMPRPILGDTLNAAALACYAAVTFMFGPPHR